MRRAKNPYRKPELRYAWEVGRAARTLVQAMLRESRMAEYIAFMEGFNLAEGE
jgi:hypothetical protein